LASRIKLEDEIIAVDDENVEKMSVIKVSKLLAQKADNDERKTKDNCVEVDQQYRYIR
jgi:C-terminal processing protease CtpA/Prc